MPIFPQETGIPQSIFKEPRSGCWRVSIISKKKDSCGDRKWNLWPNQDSSKYQYQNRTQHPWGLWKTTIWRKGYGNFWFNILTGSGQQVRWLCTRQVIMDEAGKTKTNKNHNSLRIRAGTLTGGKEKPVHQKQLRHLRQTKDKCINPK